MLKKLIPVLLALTACTSAHIIKPEHLPKNLQNNFMLISEDKSFELKDIYQQPKATVLIFWQKGCPCVKRYQARIKKLADTYTQVSFIYISSNQNETFAEALKEYKTRHEPFLLLRDEGGKLAKSLDVKGTPTAVLLDQQGEILYLGWIDNERLVGEKGRVAYLENALLEFLQNKPITTKTSPMFGCPIR